MTELKTRVVKAQLARDDYFALGGLLARRTASLADWPMRLTPAIAMLLAFVVVAGGMLFSPLDRSAGLLAGALAAAAAGAAASEYTRRRLTIRSLRVDGAFLRPFRFVADADGVTVTSDVAETRVRWAGVFGIEVTPRLVLIYIDRVNALSLPLSAFADVASMNAFADELRFLRRRAGEQKDKEDAA